MVRTRPSLQSSVSNSRKRSEAMACLAVGVDDEPAEPAGLIFGSRFTVVSWNVQAEQTRGKGRGEDMSSLRQCVSEILEKSPDVVAIMELQRCKNYRRGGCRFCVERRCKFDHASWVHTQMQMAGYDGRYHDSTMSNTVGLYVKKTKFKCEHFCFVNFDASFGVGIPSHKGAILGVLTSTTSGLRVLVTALHLSVPKVAGMHDTSTAVGELRQLAQKINDIQRHWKGDHIPLLLLGDLNTVHEDDGSNAPPDVYNALVKEWGLKSAYKTVLGSEPLFTAWKPDWAEGGFKACIDYHMYTPGALIPEAVRADLPDTPPRDYPSDHLMMSSSFVLHPLSRGWCFAPLDIKDIAQEVQAVIPDEWLTYKGKVALEPMPATVTKSKGTHCTVLLKVDGYSPDSLERLRIACSEEQPNERVFVVEDIYVGDVMKRLKKQEVVNIGISFICPAVRRVRKKWLMPILEEDRRDHNPYPGEGHVSLVYIRAEMKDDSLVQRIKILSEKWRGQKIRFDNFVFQDWGERQVVELL